MSGLFDDLSRLDLDGHVRRWSAPEVVRAGGDMNQWLAAAQQFAARVQRGDPYGVTDERWRAIGDSWSALLAAAEQATGPDEEWLFRDLWLRSWLLQTLGPREGIPLFDPEFVLVRALDAMPMSPEEAAALGLRWHEMEHSQKLEFLPQARELRKIRRLLNPVRSLAPLLADHPRWREFQAWEQVAPGLP
ncbi:hypothetical protein CLM62_44395 [Streptomyces sp. SA15]|uniref:hypothetical protein n=1 Tax=Streptomyces sp. SA15 TaxID=934019 RepID=UPI000BB0CC32|nr:hypothetical protein [Streptomyces sp. SA15]PAZ09868.1 hypothetical protein CLM62_44395 [Streptomyces sp. SA15]